MKREFFCDMQGTTLPETNSSPLKISAWETGFLVGWLMFWGYVSFRDGSITYMVLVLACFSMVFSFLL